MQKIKIFFTQNNKATLSRMPQHSQEYFLQRIKNKDFDTEGGFLEIFYENKVNATILAHPGKEIDDDLLQELGAKATRLAQSRKEKEDREIKIYFDNSICKSEKFFVEKGVLLAQHRDDFLKSEPNTSSTKIIGITHKELLTVTEGINIARILTSKPSNILNPDSFEKYIKENLEKDHGLKVKYFGQKDIEKEKMGLFLAVNQGSQYDAKMITMEYNPQNSKEKPIVLVGKGLTYDSGGYYMKPYPGMGEMHGDMAGSATVVGIMASLQKLGIKKRVIGAIGITENMVDAKSYKNGDIITARNGKTVHIEHTDAEGRLVLADVLSFVCDNYDPKLVMDFATLTGACRLAVGESYTGIFSRNNKNVSKFIESGLQTNDLVWQLPLDRHCEEAVKHKQADLNNLGKFDRMLGASTAAAFLSNFVHDKDKRIHFDIAGSALRKQQRREYDFPNLLGSGSMVHNILNFLKK